MPRLLLITNPAASRTDPQVIRTVSTVLAREGWEVDVAGTTRRGHAGELARAAVDDGVERIAIYGGDGTMIEAVSAVVGEDVEFGIIRGGTGNLLAGNLRLPRDPTKAALVVAGGQSRAIDLGRMRHPGGDHYFAVACGAGFDAELMAGTTGEAKRRWKFGAYVAWVVQNIGALRTAAYRITVDDEVLDVSASSVLVANCGEFIPPFVRLGRGIAIDDGLLDVIMLRATGVVETAAVLWQLLRGTTSDDGAVRYARGRVVTVETEPVRPIQLDGDAVGVTPFTAELLPGALRVLTPAVA